MPLLIAFFSFPLNKPLWKISILSFILSLIAFFITNKLIPILKEYTLNAGMKGKDLNKPIVPQEDKPEIPESLGIVPAVIFIIVVSIL